MFDQIGIGIIQALIVVSVVFIVLLLPIGDYLLRKNNAHILYIRRGEMMLPSFSFSMMASLSTN